MTQLAPSEIKMRSDAAWREKDLWTPVIQDCYEYANAGINPYVSDTKAPRPMNRQFDSTAVSGAKKLSNRLQTDLAPFDQVWFDVVPGPILDLKIENDDQRKVVQDKLNSAAKIGAMVVNSGHVVNALSEVFLDLVISGMGVLLALEDDEDDLEPLSCVSVSQAEVAIERDERGKIVGVYRNRKGLKVRNIKTTWKEAVIPAEVKKMMEGKNKDPEIDVLEATYCLSKKGRVTWYYEVLYCKRGNDPVRMVERTYDSNPWQIFQWSRAPGCTYGPGPMLLVLPDVRTANKMLEMIFQNAALALAGMYLVRDDGVLNPDNIQICSGGLIPVASTGGAQGASMVPLDTNRDFSVSQIVLEKVQGAIKKGLYDNSLPPMDAQNRSATEIFARLKELAQDIGGAIGRLMSDLVSFVRRVLEVLQKRGVIPFPMKLDQFTLKIQINSPLAKSAALSEVENVVRWMQLVMELGGREAAVIVANIEKIIGWIAEKLGVPSELLRSETEQKTLRDNMMRAMASGDMKQAA